MGGRTLDVRDRLGKFDGGVLDGFNLLQERFQCNVLVLPLGDHRKEKALFEFHGAKGHQVAEARTRRNNRGARRPRAQTELKPTDTPPLAKTDLLPLMSPRATSSELLFERKTHQSSLQRTQHLKQGNRIPRSKHFGFLSFRGIIL